MESIKESNNLDADLARYFVWPDLGTYFFAMFISRLHWQTESYVAGTYEINKKGCSDNPKMTFAIVLTLQEVPLGYYYY